MAFPRKTNLPDPRQPHERLSWAQFLIVERLAFGMRKRDICKALNISGKAYDHHLARIRVRMGIASLDDIRMYLAKCGRFVIPTSR